MKKQYKFVVLSNPVASREDEYNDWYTNTHLADVLKLPGAVAAKQFKLTDTQRAAPPHDWKYMAIYEIETENLNEFVDALKKRAGTKEMVMSDAMDRPTLALVFEQFAEKVKSA